MMTGQKKIAKLRLYFIHGLLFVTPFLFMSASVANPVLNNVESGNISVQQSGNTVQINQTTQRGIISWNTFNIGAGEKTQFNQPDASSITLNRVNAQMGPSLIFGQLSANGKIILINGAGLYFGTSAIVNVGSIIASTSNISNANFLAGKYIFDEPSTYRGSIINKGMITAADAGVIALLGTVVENDGYIRAHLGNVILGSGTQFTLDFSGDQLITFAVSAPVANGSVTNKGKIIADGGQVLVTAAAAQSVLDNVINMSGYVEARASARGHDGSIILTATNGNVVVNGKLNVSGSRHNNNAGKISISGNNITLSKNSTLNANGGQQGKGGKIKLVAQNNMVASGKILALGGAVAGNGGTVETSGKNLDVGSASVILTATKGQTGNWIIDPADLTISNNPSTNLSVANNTTTADQATDLAIPNLNIAQLEQALASANITVQTTNTGTGGGGDITVKNDISWASSNSLTLTAYRNINIDSGVTLANSGGAVLNLRSDNSGTGVGSVNFASNANVNFTRGGAVNIYYNPASYTTPSDYSSVVTGVTPTAYMLVNSAANLADMSSNLQGNYALGTNITMSGNFTPVGNAATPYVGKFDGQGYTINDLTIVDATNNANIGLFGSTQEASISNVNLHNVNITENANATSVAGLVGFAVDTVLHNDSVNGVISVVSNNNMADAYVGGLVGYLQGSSIISGSSSVGVISVVTNNTGSLNIGGLVGAVAYRGQPTIFAINNSYSSTNLLVSANNDGGKVNVGGLLGANGVPGADKQAINVSDSYSTGYVNAGVVNTNGGSSNAGGFIGFNSGGWLRANFWDTGTSGMMQDNGVGNISASIRGLTVGCFSGNCGAQGGTANLSAASTYTNAGWDTTTVWNVIEGQSYPYLRTQYPVTPEVISGNTPVTDGSAVKLVANGAEVATIPTGANGFYYALQAAGTIAGNTSVLAFIPGVNANAIFVTPASGSGGLSGINLVLNTISMGGDYASTITNSDFASALRNYSSSNILFTASGNNLTLGNADLVASATTTYELNGTLSSSGQASVAANISVSGNGVIATNSAADNITLTGKIDSAPVQHANLSLQGPGGIVLSGAVGSENALEDFTSDTNLEVNANVITAEGKQSYAGSVLITAPVTMMAAEFSFTAALQGGNNINQVVEASNPGFVNSPGNFSHLSHFVDSSLVLFNTPAAIPGQVLVDGTPIELLGLEAKNVNGDITIETDAPGGVSANHKYPLDENDVAIIRSYTNYVNNVPPTPAPTTAEYNGGNIVVQQVASNCSATMQNASVDMENNITLSESCTP